MTEERVTAAYVFRPGDLVVCWDQPEPYELGLVLGYSIRRAGLLFILWSRTGFIHEKWCWNLRPAGDENA